MVTVYKETNSENPNFHWKFIECDGQIVLDLGCGRWEHIEHRDPLWPTTPEYFIQKGAKHVYAFDIDAGEIGWYNENVVPKMNVTAILQRIDSVDTIKNILNKYSPQAIKIDIEGDENLFLNLSDEDFSCINFYAVETHTEDLFHRFIEKFEKLKYKITGVISLTHAKPVKVIFAKK